jgi:radical SAM-linked protein
MAQRFRVWFRKGERVRYISHLDVLRFWERAIRRAGLPLSYSQGFTPHPRLAFAGPLPLGFIGEAEVMDVTLDERVSLPDFQERLSRETSEDLSVVRAVEISPTAPAPQAVVRWADYEVALPGVAPDAAAAAVDGFLALTDYTWTEERQEKTRTYNLRHGVAGLAVAQGDCGSRLQMRLRADQEMTARPEHVVAALFPGAEPGVFVRKCLVLDEPSPARDAWRRKGRFEG